MLSIRIQRLLNSSELPPLDGLKFLALSLAVSDPCGSTRVVRQCRLVRCYASVAPSKRLGRPRLRLPLLWPGK